jgi:NAD dependent epimerase/dehydratase family enzyme
MDRSGGTFGRRLVPLGKVGLLGPLAGGGTIWSVVSLSDVVRAIRYLLEDEGAAGPYNVSAPKPTTNAEFTRLLGEAISRPTVLPVPRFGMKLVLGELADDVLASFSVVPRRLLDAGFRFEHPDAQSVVRAALAG